MDVIQILVFLGIIGWGLFQARTQKQKKPKRVMIFCFFFFFFFFFLFVLEEVIQSPVPVAWK